MPLRSPDSPADPDQSRGLPSPSATPKQPSADSCKHSTWRPLLTNKGYEQCVSCGAVRLKST